MSMVRRLKPQDASPISEIIEQAWACAQVPIGPHWTLAQTLEECLAGSGWVAVAAAELQGFLLYRDLGQAWEISFLATHPGHRNRGVMRALFQEMLQALPAEVPIWLEVHEKNSAAQRLYESLSFKMVGRRPHYYPDGGAALHYNYR